MSDYERLQAELDDLTTMKPSAARMYDYALGGYVNAGPDRAIIDQLNALGIDTTAIAYSNRAFLQRAVAFMAEQGITQFLDIGAGLPTRGSTHAAAQAIHPAATVVYVDNDIVVHEFTQQLIKREDLQHVFAVEADLARPADLLALVGDRLDWQRPVGVLLGSVLHFLRDDAQTEAVVATIAAALPRSSAVAISHATDEYLSPEVARAGEALYQQSRNPGTFRKTAAIARLFAPFRLVSPGLVLAPLWRPDNPNDPYRTTPERSGMLVGVGRKK